MASDTKQWISLVTITLIIHAVVAIGVPSIVVPPSLQSQKSKVFLTVAFALLPVIWSVALFCVRSSKSKRVVGVLNLFPASMWIVYAAQLATR